MTFSGDWVCSRLVFAADAPIHIGWHKLGLIERTRYYIPARAIWGAFVSNCAPHLFPGRPIPALYEETQRVFAESFRNTCFFPTLRATPVESEILRPRFTNENGLEYGGLSPSEFETRFVYSQTSVALSPATFTALDGALHESEFLSHPKLHFAGYIIARNSLVDKIRSAVSLINIGAERNYGWGRLNLRNFEIASAIFRQFSIKNVRSEALEITCQAYSYLPAHLNTERSPEEISGDVELLGGRNWAEKGSGRRLEKLALCWMPGTCVHSNATFEIGEQGIWSSVGSV